MKHLLLLILFSSLSCMPICAQDDYDVNHDGSVDITDVNAIISRICGTTAPDTHGYVNLGLPSGTLWATCNVGADSPEDYGDYFAWGEVNGFFSDVSYGHLFDWSNYKWMTTGYASWAQTNKYVFADGQTDAVWYKGNTFVGDGKKKLEQSDDAASSNWSTSWCMPTRAQIKELLTETDNECTEVNGVYGRKFTSKKDPQVSIFMPAAGYCSNGTLYSSGKYGFYWTNELHQDYSDLAWMYYFYSDYSSADFGDNRSTGHTIRAVRVNPVK